MTITSPESVSLTDDKTDENLVALAQLKEKRSLEPTKRSVWSSIRLKATLVAVAIATLPVIVIGATAYYFANKSITDKVTIEQQAKAVELADKTNRFMFERYGDILTLADMPVFRSPKLRADTTLLEKEEILKKYLELRQIYDEISVFDLDGNPLADFAGRKLKNHSSDEFFQLVKQTDRAVITQPKLSKSAGYVVMRLAAPIKDQVTGKTIAIVRARMPVKFLENIATTFSERGDKYHIAERSNQFFIAFEKDKVGGNVLENFSGLDQVITNRVQASTFESVQVSDKSSQLLAYGPLAKFEYMPDLGWSVILSVDTNIAFKAQRELLLTLMSGTGIAALVVGALAVWLASRFTQPIIEAAAAVEKVGQGELDTRLQTRGNDELAVLGTNINQMAVQIQTLLDNAQESAVENEQKKEAVVQESEVLQTDIGRILDVVSAVEDGDLTVEADVNDRATGLVSDTLNRLIEQLGQVLSQVQVTAKQVSTRSAELEELAKTVAGNAASQAQEVQRVLALTNQVQDSASSSEEEINLTNQSLLNMRSTVEQGQGELNTMNQGISDLQQGTDRIVQQMKALGEFVGLAEQFVQDQSQIASLTQVLALNATLVAARASEQKDPRKFAVVAREFEAIASQVGNLAQQTNSGLEALQQRTSQINAVVSGVDAEVQGLGGLVNGFTKGVSQSSQAFSNVQTIAGDAVQAGTAVTNSNQEIILAAQATAEAMRDIAVLADRTARLTQTTRAQSEQMGNLSSQLLKNVQFFRLPASTLQEQEAVQRVDLSQAQADPVAIAPANRELFEPIPAVMQ